MNLPRVQRPHPSRTLLPGESHRSPRPAGTANATSRRLALAAGLPLLAASASALAHIVAESVPGPARAGWSDEWWLWCLLLLTLVAYIVGLYRLWRTAGAGAGVERWRAAAFIAGWLTLLIALLSPLDSAGALRFSAHMIQHELLMIVAAPLLALGRPLGAFLWALPRSMRRSAWLVCRGSGLTALTHWLSRPVDAWLVHAAAIWLWHVPALFDAALRAPGIHVLQHLSFFVSALAFWWSLLRPGRSRARSAVGIVSIVTTGIHTGLLGALLTFSSSPWYAYPAASVSEALDDQQLGGLLMWVPAGGIYIVSALVLFATLLQARPSREGVAVEERELLPARYDGIRPEA